MAGRAKGSRVLRSHAKAGRSAGRLSHCSRRVSDEVATSNAARVLINGFPYWPLCHSQVFLQSYGSSRLQLSRVRVRSVGPPGLTGGRAAAVSLSGYDGTWVLPTPSIARAATPYCVSAGYGVEGTGATVAGQSWRSSVFRDSGC